MEILNPLRINDWPQRKFGIFVLCLQFSLCGLIALDTFGLGIPILREAIVFVFLTFIPGYTILRILRQHNLETIKSLLFSVGLSLSFLTLLGLFINTFYPLIGVSKPLSIVPLLITFNVAILTALFFLFLREKEFAASNLKIDISQYISPYTLSLLLLPFLAIFGTHLMNSYDINVLLLVLLAIIATIPILVAHNRWSNRLYPLTIWVIAFSLLLHNSLISNYITGWDINITYSISNLVKTNGFWDPSVSSIQNPLLVLSILSPIFSILVDINLHFVYKVIYSFFYSLVPLGLYHVYEEGGFGKKDAILACMLFMFYFYFFQVIPGKQAMAEFFLVLLLMLIVSERMDPLKRSLLAIIFSFLMILSHYGLSYLFMLFLIPAYLILFYIHSYNRRDNRLITLNYISLFFVLVVGWYMYTGERSAFSNLFYIIEHIVTNIASIMTETTQRTGQFVLAQESLFFLQEIKRYLHFLFQFFIAMGFLRFLIQLIRKEKLKLNPEFGALSILFYAFFAATFFIKGNVGVDRAFQISSVFISPFAVVGSKFLFQISSKIYASLTNGLRTVDMSKSIKFLSVCLSLFLLFNSGFIYNISGHSSTISLDSKIDAPKFSEMEHQGAEWLKANHGENSEIFGDDFGVLLLYQFFPRQEGIIGRFWAETGELKNDAYVYLRSRNIKGEVMKKRWETERVREYVDMHDSSIGHLLNEKSKIYMNGESEIYK